VRWRSRDIVSIGWKHGCQSADHRPPYVRVHHSATLASMTGPVRGWRAGRAISVAHPSVGVIRQTALPARWLQSAGCTWFRIAGRSPSLITHVVRGDLAQKVGGVLALVQEVSDLSAEPVWRLYRTDVTDARHHDQS
jgi:hypothetical protein